MRSLRSTRKGEIFKSKLARCTEQDENSNVKMCSKRLNPVKNGTRSKRQVLADKTNSGSDLNASTSSGRDVSNGNRPKRTPNLPSKFNDHILSPLTGRKSSIPDFASTPLPNNISKIKPESIRRVSRQTKTNPEPAKIVSRVNTRSRVTNRTAKTAATDCVKSPKSFKKIITKECQLLDTVTSTTVKVPENLSTPQKPVNIKSVTPIYKKKFTLLEKPSIPTPDRLALYEFDFDPSEEPTKPKKKKVTRKATAKKKKTTPDGCSEGDAALQALIVQLKKIQETQKIKHLLRKKNINKNVQKIMAPVPSEPLKQSSEIIPICDKNSLVQNPPAKQCIENILSPIPRTRFCYSPRSPSPFEDNFSNVDKPAEDNSNISLRNVTDMRSVSFFSDVPAASSSMIQGSAHKPAASPWRVNYDNEIKKWPCNFYVKASMTPSYERDTFHIIGLDDNINKANEHNTVPERPTKYVNDSQKSSNWKQTSILSFYEESMKKTAKKRSHSPKKPTEPYNFDELNPPTPIKEPSTEEVVQVTPEKTPPKTVYENPTLDNCFGFDDSADFDQENVSPVKIPKIQNLNVLRHGQSAIKKRGILREINAPVNIPTRAVTIDVLHIIEKQKEIIAKAVKVIPQVIAVEKEINTVNSQTAESDDSSNVEDVTAQRSTDNSQVSCESELALFEDPAKADEPKVVHYTKPSRRSYGRKKKPLVTFHLSPVDSDKEISIDEESDYMSDSSTASREKKAKKLVKKKKKQTAKSKKEEKEVNEWAAGFNSMLEEVDDFALCIE